jgi:hypothetical protein
MRCFACNVVLTPQESTRKFSSGEYVDLCTKCLGTIQEDVVTEDSDTYEQEKEDE